MLNFIRLIHKYFSQALLTFAGLCLVFMMFLGFADVFARYFFEASIVEREELFRVSLIFVFVLSFPVISLNRDHLSVDLLDNTFKGAAKKIQFILVDVLVAISCAVMGYWMWDKSERISRTGREVMFDELGIQQGYFAKFFAVVLFAVALTTLLVVILEFIALFNKSVEYDPKAKPQENL